MLIAPHGHPNNDGRTYSITRLASDVLDSYAIVNKTYQKPPFKRNKDSSYVIVNGKKVRHDPDKLKKWINLNRKNQVEQHLGTEFKVPLRNFVNEIIQKYGNAIVIWIHGIDDDNLTPKNTYGSRPGMDALIGIGQGEPDSLTASNKTVAKLIKYLSSNSAKPIAASLAKKGSDYCGWHQNVMNQFFVKQYGLDKVESIQIEIKKKGFRESGNYKITAQAIAKSIMEMTLQKPKKDTESASVDSADQNGTIQQIKAGDIDLDNDQFKARIDEIDSDSIEFKRLVESVGKDGVLNNIIVRLCCGDGDEKPYQLISGFRRMTALKASKNGLAGFKDEPVWARVLDANVSNDDAYRISFTENLARKDLSLWEIAQACAEIKKKMEVPGKIKGDIDDYIASLIQKDKRTVRRYLKLASIQNNKTGVCT